LADTLSPWFGQSQQTADPHFGGRKGEATDTLAGPKSLNHNQKQYLEAI
jgi:hypothetical protein